MRAENEKEFQLDGNLIDNNIGIQFILCSYFLVIGSGLEVPSCPEPDPFGDNAAMQSVLWSIPPFPKLGPYTLLQSISEARTVGVLGHMDHQSQVEVFSQQ